MGESGNENLADSAGKTPGSERNLRIFEVNAGNSRWTDPDPIFFSGPGGLDLPRGRQTAEAPAEQKPAERL